MRLVGWCLSAKAKRSFRLDRITSVEVLDVPSVRHRAPRRKHRSTIDRSVGEKPRATLTLRPTGRWLAELGPVPLPGGRPRTATFRWSSRDATAPGSSAWSSQRGAILVAVEPPELAQEAAASANQALTSYNG